MKVEPYKSVGFLKFGESKQDDCRVYYGEPTVVRNTPKGVEEYHYSNFIVRFNPRTNAVQECTLLPRTKALIADVDLTWDKAFLRSVCELDGDPKESFGFIMLMNIGIAVTGIHDHDESQLAVTVFAKGLWGDLKGEATSFDVSSIH